MKRIKEFIKKEKVERALKTFVEAFASYIAINIMSSDFSSEEAIKGLIVGALASAISVVINSFRNEREEDE